MKDDSMFTLCSENAEDVSQETDLDLKITEDGFTSPRVFTVA
jgi:hypothetical protein